MKLSLKGFFSKFMLDRELAKHTEVLKETIDGNMKAGQDICFKDGRLFPCEPAASGRRAIIGPEMFKDLEVFQDYQNDESSVFDACLAPSTTSNGGRSLLRWLIERPLSDSSVLCQRQHSLQQLAEFLTENNSSVKTIMDTLHDHEEDVQWFFREHEEGVRALYDMVYFKSWFLRQLNRSDKVLALHNYYRIIASPLIGILSPVVYFIVPYLILTYKLKIKIGYYTYLKLIFAALFSSVGDTSSGIWHSSIRYVSYSFTLLLYFQNVFNSIELAKASHMVIGLITRRMDGLAAFKLAAYKLSEILPGEIVANLQRAFFEEETRLPAYKDQGVDKQFTSQKGLPLLLRNFGAALSSFKQVEKSTLLVVLRYVYQMDACMAIVRLHNEKGFSYADFEGNQAKIEQLWHPSLADRDVVKNDVDVCNAIVTGPNAGGKSTLLKSILLAVLLSQTITVGNFASFSFRPYAYMSTQMNVPDCKGRASLFEAEMYRCKQHLDALKDLGDRPCILAMDEIFSSTNPVEGIAGAFAIAKQISKNHPNAACLISTHYLYLTKLHKEANFLLYRMNVSIDPNLGSITYPYLLSRGISKQYIALEILKKNGFDACIVEEAVQIKQRLLSVTKPKHDLRTNDDTADIIKPNV